MVLNDADHRSALLLAYYMTMAIGGYVEFDAWYGAITGLFLGFAILFVAFLIVITYKGVKQGN